jgi:hypothetical protein
MFRAVLDRLETIEPSEALVVGDLPYDAQEAEKLGLSTVGLFCDGFPEDELGATNCIAIFSYPTDLLDVTIISSWISINRSAVGLIIVASPSALRIDTLAVEHIVERMKVAERFERDLAKARGERRKLA